MRHCGCGPKWLHWRIRRVLFDWFFFDQCSDHDISYGIGGSEFDRWAADWLFFVAMLMHTTTLPCFKRPVALVQAVLFYAIVVVFGWTRYKYR